MTGGRIDFVEADVTPGGIALVFVSNVPTGTGH